MLSLVRCGGGGASNGQTNGTTVSNASANTGSGAGGQGGGGTGGIGGNGGSGIVILRYLGNQKGTGGTISFNNGYTYHTFISSGTFTG